MIWSLEFDPNVRLFSHPMQTLKIIVHLTSIKNNCCDARSHTQQTETKPHLWSQDCKDD